jgi:hypothetical protein
MLWDPGLRADRAHGCMPIRYGSDKLEPANPNRSEHDRGLVDAPNRSREGGGRIGPRLRVRYALERFELLTTMIGGALARPLPDAWLGEETFRVLSYRFGVRWGWEEAGAYVRFALGRFVAGPSEVSGQAGRELPCYRFTSDGTSYLLRLQEEVIAESGDPRDALNHFSWHVNSEAMQTAVDQVVIHAGAVVTPTGGGVLLPGPSGSGKTGLVAGLVRRGFGYLSDEAGAIDPVTRRVCPYPKALSIKPGMFDRFTDVDRSRAWPISARMWLIDAETLRSGAIANPTELDHVIFPTHRAGATTHVTALSSAETVIALFDNTANRSIFGPRALPLLGDLAKRAVSYRLETSDPDEAVRVVSELTAG